MDSQSPKRRQTMSAASTGGAKPAVEMKAVSVDDHLKSGAQWFNFFHGTSRKNLSNLVQTGLHPAFGGGKTPPNPDMMREHLLEQSKELGKRMRAAGLESKSSAGEPTMSSDEYFEGMQKHGNPQFYFNSVGKVHYSATPKEAREFASNKDDVLIAARIPRSWQREARPDPDLPGGLTTNKAVHPSRLYVLANHGWVPLQQFVGRERAYGGTPNLAPPVKD